MEIELSRYFGERTRQTVLSLEGFREMTPHPDGGTTLIFERASSAHKVQELMRQRNSDDNSPEGRAIRRAAGAMLNGQKRWIDQPSLERVRVAEDISTVTQRMSAAKPSL